MRYVILSIVGLILAFGVISLLQTDKVEPSLNDGEHVLIARINLQPGTFIIGAQHLEFRDIPSSERKGNIMLKKFSPPNTYEGAVVRRRIKTGEPIIKDNIVTPREGGFLSAVLYPGMRAISVAVDVVSANAGFIFPGDRVDLLLTHEVRTPDGKQGFGTETFVEDVRVLAVDQLVSNADNKAIVPKTVTMEVTPKQAEEVLVATQLGKISLVLRSIGNTSFNNVTAVTPHDSGKTYTRDNEVSKILNEYRPNEASVTVTRGKETTIYNSGSSSPAP